MTPEETMRHAWRLIINAVKKLHDEDGKTFEKIGAMCGASKPTVQRWYNETEGGVNTPFANVLRCIQGLGIPLKDVFPNEITPLSKNATMRRPGTHSPVEPVSGDNLVLIPVRIQAGAGGEVDVFSPEPQKFIYVLPRYAQKNVEAVEVTGDSMEPIVKKGAFVGVVPFEELEEGQMYLVSRPPFGLVVKRVITNAAGQIVLRSENKTYEDQIVPNEGYAEIIIGKVVWIWQLA